MPHHAQCVSIDWWIYLFIDSRCTINLHVAGWEWNRFEEVRIAISQFIRQWVITTNAVVVSTKSLRVVLILRMNADPDRKKTLKMGEYSACCLHDHRSPRRHCNLQMQINVAYISTIRGIIQSGAKKWHLFDIWASYLVRWIMFAIFVYSHIIFIKWNNCSSSADVNKFCFYAISSRWLD